LCPLWDIFVLYLFGLLAHRRLLLYSTGFFYPEEAQCNPWLNVSHRGDLSPYSPKYLEGKFLELRSDGVLRSSPRRFQRIEWWRMPLFTPEEREETAEQVSRVLSDDSRVEGVVVVGSLAHQADRWSDIDLEVVVADGEDLATVTADWVGYLYELLPVVHHFERAFGGTLVRGFLLENLLELDLAFERAGRFSIWGPARVVFDRSGRVADAANALAQGEPESADRAGEAGFAWHDVLHACTAVRRGRSWQGVWYLERVRNRTLKLAQERRGYYAEFFDYVDDLPLEELRALEDTLVFSLDPASLLGAIEVATRAFLAELGHDEPALAERLEGPLLEFVRLREP
jgi:predicted nucleotidyltransferase